MNRLKEFFVVVCVLLVSCSNDDTASETDISITFEFTHDWDALPISNSDFNDLKFTTANNDLISIERLRYLISDLSFTRSNGEVIEFDLYNLVDVTNNSGLRYSPEISIPKGDYTNVSFTFGFDNEDNSESYTDLNSASFNVPDMLGGGYHYMQFDGKFINDLDEEQGFNYHAIRAADNPGPNPSFPQDTFITVNLGSISVSTDTGITIGMNVAEWFKNPNLWDLNVLNSVLMPNSDAQIMMFENGQNVFSLKSISEE